MSSETPSLVIVCGSRDIDDYDIVARAIERTGWSPSRVIAGDCTGVDEQAIQWAFDHDIFFHRFEHDEDPKQRNTRMANFVTDRTDQGGCIAIPGPESRGTWDMVRKAKDRGMKVSVYDPLKEERQEGLF